MKGKKTDFNFINSFVEECISKNLFSSEDFLKEANNQIMAIDLKLKEIDNLKKLRSSLLDVVHVFNLEKKDTRKAEDAEILGIFNLPHKNICFFICKKIKLKPVSLKNLKSSFEEEDLFFALKKMIENKIVYKQGDYILRGSLYDKFMSYFGLEILNEYRN